MFIHNVYLSSYSPCDPLSGRAEIRDDSSTITLLFNEDEASQIHSIAEAAYQRNQEALLAKIATPLETFRLPPPESVIEEAEFVEAEDEVGF